MNGPAVLAKIEEQLRHVAETEIQEVIVDLMMDSMREPFLSALPPDFDLSDLPPPMVDQFLASIKGQMMVSLKSLINANKENSQINELIVRKHFKGEEVAEAQRSVDRYSQAYAEEVETFYNLIRNTEMEALFSQIG